MSRINKITFKVSASEREELNALIMRNASNISDLIREALKKQYKLEEFEPSYTKAASKSYDDKWRLY